MIFKLCLKGAKIEEFTISNVKPDKQNNTKIQFFLMMSASILVFLINGLDNLFQSFIYTYGLCGPFRLPATTAGWLNTLYYRYSSSLFNFVSVTKMIFRYSCYFIGRLTSIPLAALFTPAKVILATSIGCLASTLILCLYGTSQTWALFLSTGLMGLCLCFHFGSAINWLNSKTEKSTNISFIYMGANLSSLCYPPLVSKLFYLDPNYVSYLAVASVVSLILCFCSMIVLAKKLK